MRRATLEVICLCLLLSISIFLPMSAAHAQVKPHRVLAAGHEHPVLALAFSPDGKSLASASLDKTIVLWDTETFRVRHKFEGHSHVPITFFQGEMIRRQVGQPEIALSGGSKGEISETWSAPSSRAAIELAILKDQVLRNPNIVS